MVYIASYCFVMDFLTENDFMTKVYHKNGSENKILIVFGIKNLKNKWTVSKALECGLNDHFQC